MKILRMEIRDCYDCPHMQSNPSALCRKEMHLLSLHKETFPEWCPLPGAEKGEGDEAKGDC